MGVTAFANAAKAELLASKAKAEAQEAQTQAALALQQMIAAEKQSSDIKAGAKDAIK